MARRKTRLLLTMNGWPAYLTEAIVAEKLLELAARDDATDAINGEHRELLAPEEVSASKIKKRASLQKIAVFERCARGTSIAESVTHAQDT